MLSTISPSASPTLLIPLLLLLATLVYKYILHPALISPLARIPPIHPLCTLTDRYFSHLTKTGRPWSSIRQAHNTHGPLIRIGPHEVSVASTEGLQKIYTAGLDRHPWYIFFQNFDTPNLVSMQDGRTHSIQKRMISAVYAKSYLAHSEDVRILSREIVGERLLPLLTGYVRGGDDGEGKGCDVIMLAQRVGMDMMTAYLFGLKNGTDWLGNLDQAERYLAEFETKRDEDGQAKYSEDVCMGLCKAARGDVLGETEMGETRPVVFERLYKPLRKILAAEGMTEAQVMRRVASEMMDQMLASHETTSITLTYAVWHLSQDARLQQRLREELSTLSPRILSNVQAGDDFDLPSPSAIDALPLLNCILTETLRLHAAAPGVQSRVVPAGGITLHASYLPAGTVVSSNAYTLHRDENVFPDAESWQPERWANMKDTAHQADDAVPMRRFFWAFGSGGRMCIGSNFALQMLKLALASIYSNYTTSIVDDEGIEQEETIIARPKGNKLIVKFHSIEA